MDVSSNVAVQTTDETTRYASEDTSQIKIKQEADIHETVIKEEYDMDCYDEAISDEGAIETTIKEDVVVQTVSRNIQIKKFNIVLKRININLYKCKKRCNRIFVDDKVLAEHEKSCRVFNYNMGVSSNVTVQTTDETTRYASEETSQIKIKQEVGVHETIIKEEDDMVFYDEPISDEGVIETTIKEEVVVQNIARNIQIKEFNIILKRINVKPYKCKKGCNRIFLDDKVLAKRRVFHCMICGSYN